jgi:hypothetical protein
VCLFISAVRGSGNQNCHSSRSWAPITEQELLLKPPSLVSRYCINRAGHKIVISLLLSVLVTVTR